LARSRSNICFASVICAAWTKSLMVSTGCASPLLWQIFTAE
jgi:hypothetical protein